MPHDEKIIEPICNYCGSTEHTTYECPDTETFVACDDACRALDNPTTIDELEKALEHWRSHSWCAGCSHGC
tara:strand:- start:35 stop:247 length:213 start_codon:yes stop_codon:yes gene_type:complete